MDFEQDNNDIESSLGQQMPLEVKEKPKKRRGWRIFWIIMFVFSVIANFVLFLLLIGVSALLVAGQKGVFTEEIIQAGPKTSRIVVINIEGIIDTEQSQKIYRQLKTAREEKHIKGLIIRTNSPGGTISGSDQIYNEILKFREETKKPVVAFMQGVAASGGYYTSVACDRIMAEPTAITGSIGVIMGHFVLQGLLEEKLGIEPVIFKSGPKKDWPSPFEPVTEEQKKYIEEKLIGPFYERFVLIVDEGREQLSLAEVKTLADGSIYGAQEALDEKLIDDIGYFDDAIELVKELADIEEAQVVEYQEPFTFRNILASSGMNLLKIDQKKLYELSVPQVMYLWTVY